MFEGFKKSADPDTKRRLAFSAGASVALYGGLAIAMFAAAQNVAPEVKKEKALDVVFRPPPAKKPKPAPPPPPSIPKSLKTKTVAMATLPPPAPLVEPTKLSDKKLKEGDPTKDVIRVGEGGGNRGEGGGQEGGTAKVVEATPVPVAPAPAPVKKKPEAVNLPEDAEPPEPDENNALPEYPEEMRTKGIEAQVILKVVITEEGLVTNIQVLRGEEPFVSAAKAVVKSWKFTPAKLEGASISVFKIIKIPFTLKG
jgi:periplasmic protein TonB